MHEMSLCENLRDIICDHAQSEGFRHVATVRLEVGALSCVEPEALRFAFDIVMQNTPAEHATLDIVSAPGEAYCVDCAQTAQLKRRGDPCPRCGGYVLQITGGDQLRIRELEVT